MKPDANELKQFNLSGKIVFLSGGEGRTYKVGKAVLKHINKDSQVYTQWIAELFAHIKENGFRVSKPIPTIENKWITQDGWTAWTFLEGNHDFKGFIKESITAVNSFHEAIKDIPRPVIIGNDDSGYTRADRAAWGDKPTTINEQVKEMVDALYEIRKPIAGLRDQLIHGDLNPDNILIAPGMPPAIIDIAPYWRPPEFALAVYAYWIACYRNDPEMLTYFSEVKEFKQMLIRAGIRMLLIMSEFNTVHEVEKYMRVTEIIQEFV